MSRERARSTVLIDNERVRMTEWRFAPESSTHHHRHEFDYVVVPMTTGRLLIKTANGESFSDLATGVPYFRKSGVEHEVINANDVDFVFIEIEIK
ncbi:MAG: cupin domain-containing protein [Candidatus Bathyarchaeia archaeon]